MSLKSSTELKSTESPETLVHSPSVVTSVGVGRRRLLRAGLAATPVILAVSGRSAMAGTGDPCPKGLSPLAWSSWTNGGTTACVVGSHTHTSSSHSYCHTPTSWKCQNGNFPVAWPSSSCKPYSGYNPGDQGVKDRYNNWITDWNTGHKFNQCFSGSTRGHKDKSCSKVLRDHGASVEAYLCAAYLNAQFSTSYCMSVQDVRDLEKGKCGTLTGLTDTQIINFCKQSWGA